MSAGQTPTSVPGHALAQRLSCLHQRGVVLFWALIAMVAISLAAVALIRSVDTSTLIAGNLAFRQTAMHAGDAGFDSAVTWLSANASGATLDADSSANGYYATSQSSLDITGKTTPTNPADNVDWDGTNGAALTKAKILTADAAGNTVSYIIHRLCAAAGSKNDPANQCVTYQSTNSPGSTKGSVSYGAQGLTGSTQVYYRITSRILGPRNTVSYVQAVVLL